MRFCFGSGGDSFFILDMSTFLKGPFPLSLVESGSGCPLSPRLRVQFTFVYSAKRAEKQHSRIALNFPGIWFVEADARPSAVSRLLPVMTGRLFAGYYIPDNGRKWHNSDIFRFIFKEISVFLRVASLNLYAARNRCQFGNLICAIVRCLPVAIQHLPGYGSPALLPCAHFFFQRRKLTTVRPKPVGFI